MTAIDTPLRLLTVRESADRLGLSKETVYRLIRTGAMPAVKVGGQLRIDPVELHEYVYGEPR